jgi:hypothetical protein
MHIGQRIVAGLLVGAGLLMAAFAGGPALAQDDDFCTTYAYEALEASKQHRDNQCGGDLTNYSLNEADHYRICMSWGAEAMKYATQATNTRAQDFYNCKANAAGVAAIDLGHTEYENDYPRPGDKFGFCSNYAFWATTQRGVAVREGCGFSEASGRWGEAFNLHRAWCMGLNPGDGGALSGEINNRTNELVQCQLTIKDMNPIGKSADECVAANARCSNRFGNDPNLIAAQCTPQFQVCMGDVQRREAEFAADMDPFGKDEAECVASSQRCEARVRAALTGPFADAEIQKQCTPLLQVCLASAQGLITPPPDEDERTGVIKQPAKIYATKDYQGDNGELDTGDQVTIIGTCPDPDYDSCEITAPVAGFIDFKDLE